MSKNKLLNRTSSTTNLLFSFIFLLLSFICVIPVVFLVIISLSSQSSIDNKGYSFFPESFSLDAYIYLLDSANTIIKAFGISFIVTLIGTIIGLFMTLTMGYSLSRPNYKLKKIYTWLVFIPMIFSGGLVATYNVYTTMLHIKNSLWVLILPMTVSSFNVIIAKTFFKTSIPDSIVESAKIDGAAQLKIFFRIILPISLPLIATIGLFLSFGYWNDWWLSLMYIDNSNIFSLQAILMSVERNIEFLTKNASTVGVTSAEYAARMPRESMRMAMAVVIIFPIACAYPFFQKYFVTGLTVGAIKG